MLRTSTRLIRLPVILVHSVYVSKKAQKNQRIRDSLVADVSSDSTWKGSRAFVFGFCATGALGVKQLVIPKTPSSLLKRAVSHPIRLSDLENPIAAACGYGFTMYLCKSTRSLRSIFGCGLNSDGQLGQLHGLTTEQPSTDRIITVIPTPQQIHLPLNDDEKVHLQATHIDCGRSHTLIALHPLTSPSQPSVFSMGNNTFGQCGRQVIADEIYSPQTAVITRVRLPVEVDGLKQICCGQDHSLLLSSAGLVYSSGLGSDGQLGLGHLGNVDQFVPVRGALRSMRISQISSSADTVLAVSECNRLFSWGNNEYGQIWPTEEQLQQPNPIELPLDECVIPPECGSQFTQVKIGRITSIACAGSMCALLDDQGYLFVWGFGCIGLGPNRHSALRPTLMPPGLFAPAVPGSDQQLIEVRAGLHHFITRSRDGLLWAWGAPRGGVECLGLGKQLDKHTTRQTYPCPVTLPGRATDVACGVDHTVVLTKSTG